jgi:hypothetical protein
MSQSTPDLSNLFGVALEAMKANREQINALDGYNGNHGDNMVENLRLIRDALEDKESESPADGLRYASQRLESEGRGGTSQYYVRGLNQAADQLQGRSALDGNSVMTLVQSILGAVPSEGHPQETQSGSSVLEHVIGMAGAQPVQPEPQSDGLGMDDLLSTLLPAGLAFFQAKQSGADTSEAISQVLMGVLTGGQANPLQANTPRDAAGGLVAQSILQALAGKG